MPIMEATGSKVGQTVTAPGVRDDTDGRRRTVRGQSRGRYGSAGGVSRGWRGFRATHRRRAPPRYAGDRGRWEARVIRTHTERPAAHRRPVRRSYTSTYRRHVASSITTPPEAEGHHDDHHHVFETDPAGWPRREDAFPVPVCGAGRARHRGRLWSGDPAPAGVGRGVQSRASYPAELTWSWTAPDRCPASSSDRGHS